MKRKLTGLFWVIEINLILWLCVLMLMIQSKEVNASLKYTAGAGAAFAAVIQHWAYYNLRKSTTGDKKQVQE